MKQQNMRRDGEVGESIKLLREKDEKIKSLRTKKKALKREIEEVRGKERSMEGEHE